MMSEGVVENMDNEVEVDAADFPNWEPSPDWKPEFEDVVVPEEYNGD